MTAVSPVTKTARQAHVAEILARTRVRSQEELAELLAQRGVRVAQATLSRDLEDLGAVRLRGADGALVYALPGDPGGFGSRPGGLQVAEPGAARVAEPGAARVAEPGAARVAEPGGARVAEPGGARVAEPGGLGEPVTAVGQRPEAGHGRVSARRRVGVAGGATAGGAGGGTADRTRGESTEGPDALDGTGQGGGTGRGRDHTPGGGPRLPGAGSGALTRLAVDLLVTAEASANLVVLRTPAGGAQLLASAIDHAGWSSILGTVAGDDTVLVIARDPGGGDEVARSLIRLAERRS